MYGSMIETGQARSVKHKLLFQHNPRTDRPGAAGAGAGPGSSRTRALRSPRQVDDAAPILTPVRHQQNGVTLAPCL